MRYGNVKILDFEAREWTNFFIGSIYDGRKWELFDNIKDVWRYIELDTFNNPVYFAHNGGKYDYLMLLVYGYNNGKDMHIIPQGSRILQMIINNAQMLDSLMILPEGLGKLAPKFGFQKGELNYHNIEQEMKDGKVIPYLKNDCYILYEILKRYNESLVKLGYHLDMTLATIANKIYRKMYYEKKWNIDYPHNDILRDSYSGGRTEPFKQYTEVEGLNYDDINSCYATAMLNRLPSGKVTEISREKEIKRILDIDDSVGFLKCRVYCDENMYMPVLPYKAHNKLLFPVGVFSGIWTFHEIRKALSTEKYKLLEIDKAWYYPNADYIMKDFAIDFYNQRIKSETDSDKLIFKIILNAAYGKFGIRPERERFKIINSSDPHDADGYKPYFGNIWIEKYITKHDNARVAIASYITSYARLLLYKYLDKNTYYCDTDGIFTTSDFSKDYGEGLGQLKHKRYKYGEFILPKLYRLVDYNGKETMKAKGFGHFVELGSWIRLLYKEQLDYYQILTFKTMVQAARKRNDGGKLKMERVKKQKGLFSDYNKRIWLENGIDSKPVTIYE